MHPKERELYSSANGDTWYLGCDESGRLYVEHRPNLPSGGQVSRVDVGSFLGAGARGPEHQALLQLIGSLLDAVPQERAVRTA
jgi:hypothetical protein